MYMIGVVKDIESSIEEGLLYYQFICPLITKWIHVWVTKHNNTQGGLLVLIGT